MSAGNIAHLAALQMIKNIAEGSTTANSLPHIAKIAGAALGLEPIRAGSLVFVKATHTDCALGIGATEGAAIDPNVIREKRQQHCDCHPSTAVFFPDREQQQDASTQRRAHGNRISHPSELSQSFLGNT